MRKSDMLLREAYLRARSSESTVSKPSFPCPNDPYRVRQGRHLHLILIGLRGGLRPSHRRIIAGAASQLWSRRLRCGCR